jgi:hypothetical protein
MQHPNIWKEGMPLTDFNILTNEELAANLYLLRHKFRNDYDKMFVAYCAVKFNDLIKLWAEYGQEV